MKTLYLVRHAKSSWEFDLDDHKRPLNDRGLRDAPRVAAKVAKSLPRPDLAMSSDAMRAKTTALFFTKAFGIPENELVLEPKLYDFSGNNVLQVIRTCPDTVDCLLLFGHNNAMTTIVNVFGSKVVDNVPTCGFIAIEFNITHWRDLEQGTTFFTCIPKEL
jgi:phosphohistidine phosphatase